MTTTGNLIYNFKLGHKPDFYKYLKEKIGDQLKTRYLYKIENFQLIKKKKISKIILIFFQ